MAEETITEVPETVAGTEQNNSSTTDMGVEALIPASVQADGDALANGDKREREEGDKSEKEENDGAKKPKVDKKSVEEQRLEEAEKSEAMDGENGSGMDTGPVSLGPKSFGTSIEIFDYFYKFLHSWSPNLNVNKYEHMMLLDLLKKGHLEAERKIGKGIHAFQVRFHPQYKSRCFFIIRDDDSVDDFSFRKCVDHILPLPENMQIKSDVNKALGGRSGGGHGGKFGGGGGHGGHFGGGGRGGWRGRGRGRGGKPRN